PRGLSLRVGPEREAPAYRVLAGPVALRQGLADDGDLGRLLHVPGIEGAPSQDRDAQGPEVVDADLVEAPFGSLAQLVLRPSRDLEAQERVGSAERQVAGEAGRRDAGQLLGPSQDIIV